MRFFVSSTWVLTRAQPDADADVAAMQARGLRAIAVPCIERVALPWPRWSPPMPRKLVFVTSPYAATRLVEAWPQLPVPKPSVAAMAPITSERLHAHGVPTEVSAEGGVVALASALQRWNAGNPLAVLYATSDVGILQAEQEEAMKLMKSFAMVERVPVYSTRAPLGLDASLAALEPGLGYVFLSPSAVENALASFARQGRTLFANAVACIGQSTQRRYRDLAVHPAPARHVSFNAFLQSLPGEP